MVRHNNIWNNDAVSLYLSKAWKLEFHGKYKSLNVFGCLLWLLMAFQTSAHWVWLLQCICPSPDLYWPWLASWILEALKQLVSLPGMHVCKHVTMKMKHLQWHKTDAMFSFFPMFNSISHQLVMRSSPNKLWLVACIWCTCPKLNCYVSFSSTWDMH